MKVLPPITKPWSQTIPRRHHPREATGKSGFTRFRSCLRWDFSFSCAFCLCHEADLFHYGTRGSGLMTIEHFLRKAPDQHPEARNRYDNCFQACRYCNRARGIVENVDGEGNRLLNPCTDVWQNAFEMSRDEISPRDGNSDAAYTCDTYDLNAPIKVTLRQRRRETIEECMALANRQEIRALHDELLSGSTAAVDAARKLWDAHKRARKDLRQFKAVPLDADWTCQCEHIGDFSLHAVLDEQTLEIDLD
jgi:hypothetical protein